jgi:hypothetical protein
VNLAQAKRNGITEDAYLAALADRQDTNKYYEFVVGSDGKRVRRRREGVYPASLCGLHRAVCDPRTNKVAFYER